MSESSVQAWGRWGDQYSASSPQPYYMNMQQDVHYDPRTTSTNVSHPTVAPQYAACAVYTELPSNLGCHRQPPLLSSNTYYNDGNTSSILPGCSNRFQPQPVPSTMGSNSEDPRHQSYRGAKSHGYLEDHHIHIQDTHYSCIDTSKLENSWKILATHSGYSLSHTHTHNRYIAIEPLADREGIIGGTDVDALMRVVQAKTCMSPTSSPSTDASQIHGSRKRHACTHKQCDKIFYQKTHLDIHMRKHTGAKPYSCHIPNCDRSFSQIGKRTTHMRRHTGERPFACEICGKRFPQRGNVAAHKIAHNASKPYLCELDYCGKQFTTKGNLKSHQNKFHAETIHNLILKFATVSDPEMIDPVERNILDSFAHLYRNTNKGIKGRGKNRRVATARRQ